MPPTGAARFSAQHGRAPDPGLQATALTVLAVCFLMNLLARGMSETWVVFLLPLGAEFGWSRGELAGVYSVFMVVHGLAAPLAGFAFDAFGPRASYGLGLASLGAGYFLAGQLDALWQFYLCVGLLGGIGVAALGMVTASGLISRWFRRRIGTAMGLAFAGLGSGVILLVPFTQWLIEQVGWRGAYTWLGGGLLLALPLLMLLPWRRYAAGHPRYAPLRSAGGADGWNLARAARDRAFWGLVAVFAFTGAAIYATTIQVVAYLVEIGFAPLQAATAFGVAGALSVAGMTAAGWMADRLGRRRTAAITFSFTIAGIGFLLLLALAPGAPLLVLFVLCFGISAGSRGPVVSTMAAELFPGGGLGAIYGVVTMGMGLGAGAGSWLSGLLYDATGGYVASFTFAAAAALLGLAQFWLVPELARGRRQ